MDQEDGRNYKTLNTIEEENPAVRTQCYKKLSQTEVNQGEADFEEIPEVMSQQSSEAVIVDWQ